MRKLFKERKLFKGGNYMRKYGILNFFFDSIVLRETPQLLDLYLTKSVLADIYLAKMQSN